jgi:hypothetical protein
VFVHISAVERAGFSSLNEGQTVEFESNRGKESAVNLKNPAVVEQLVTPSAPTKSTHKLWKAQRSVAMP